MSLRRKKKQGESKAVVVPLFPPEPRDMDEEEDLEAYHVVTTAIAEAESFRDGSVVAVEEDPLLGKDVVTLEGGHARLELPTRCEHPWLIFHLRNRRRFFSIEVVLRDSSGKHRVLTMSNHVSLATMDAPNGNAAQLPLSLGEEWQIIPVDLASLVKAIWGTEHRSIEQVRVNASTSVRRIFAADKPYADVELPEYLRALC
mmetsp:Transcript_60192/g.136085  ORF Transcript_60192/g.136085 Transcript_60192/m.136085 type:complete len:201 (-) Transcript_60192:273-875(-)